MCSEKLSLGFIREIWQIGKELGLADSDIHSVFDSVIYEEECKDQQSGCSGSRRQISYKRNGYATLWRVTTIISAIVKLCAIMTALGIFFSAALYFHNPSKKLVMRNIQDVIYPLMTYLRYMTLPILEEYPHLSQWYSEECLIKNSFFDQSNIDCRPCEREVAPVYARGLKNFSEVYYNTGKLVIISDAMHSNVTVESILEMIDINEEINLGAFQFSSKNIKVNFRSQVKGFHSVRDDIHIEWKINRLETLHLVRKLFPRVYFIPQETEVSLHRYLFVDGPVYDSYFLPLTEFANILLMQGEGESIITMIPSNHCKSICKPVDLFLNSSQVVFFNWIYWRPLRQGGNHTSVLLMSSFY